MRSRHLTLGSALGPVVRSAAVVVLASLIATLFALATSVPTADAQERAECGDGLGNALNQWRDNTAERLLGEISDWIQDHPWKPESLDEFWNRCGPRAPEPPPPGYGDSLPGPDDPRGRRGSSSGDPHIVTQDGVRYAFHGSGDFSLLETLDGSTTLQIRYRGSGPMTTFDGVAGSVDGVRFSMNRFMHGELAQFYIGDELIELPADGWYDLGVGFVLHFNNVFTVYLNNGIVLHAQRSGLGVFTPNSLDGTFVGLHGNGDGDPTNDLATRSGTIIDGTDLDVVYGDFLDSWAVTPQDSLFGVPGDVATPPPERITLADLDPAAIDAALAICTDAGLVSGAGLEECIFDVALTGDPVWAQNLPSPATEPAIPAALLAPAADPIPIEALTTVTASFDSWQTTSYAVASTNVERTLRVQPPCQEFGAPLASIISQNQLSTATSLTCDTVIAVPSGAFELRIASPHRLQQEFTFTLGEAAMVDLGTIDSGTSLVGSLQPGESATGQLDFDDAARVFFDAGPLADCAVMASIIDAGGIEVLPPRDSCVDLGPVQLTGTAPFTLRLQADAAADYDLTATAVQDDASVDAAVGRDIAFDVASPSQSVSASLTLQAGERVYIETLESIPGTIRLLGVDGVELQRSIAINDLGLIEATSAGDYTLIFEPNGASTGSQLVRIFPVTDDTVISALPDDIIELQITSPGQLAAATIDLAAGERVYVETQTTINGDLTATAPDGTETRVLALNDLGLIEATSAGEHTITLSGRDASTGTQTLSITAVAADTTTTANVGDQVELQIETPGQSTTVTFELDAGDVVTISNDQQIDGFLTIIDPAGAELLIRPSVLELGEITAPTSGTYTIRLRGRDAATGSQIITIELN